jgi:hypothetical protein
MDGWRELSIDEMLADPIIGALMAADGVVSDQLRALLRSVAEAIGQHNPAGASGKALACLASLFGATLRARDFPQAANRDRGNVRRARTAPQTIRAYRSRRSGPHPAPSRNVLPGAER